MPPSPEHCLYFYPRSQPQPFNALGQPITAYNNIIMGQIVTSGHKLLVPDGYCMFKIQCQPNGLFQLFDLPMTLFANGFEETASVLGNHAIGLLTEQIMNATSFADMVRFSEAFLLRQLSRKKRPPLPIDKLLHLPTLHTFSIDQLAHEACLSTRQFERKFLEWVGISPKLYQRLIRFNQAMKLKDASLGRSWTDIAYTCGYYDPMHFLRDFRQFTGTTPTGFDVVNAVIY